MSSNLRGPVLRWAVFRKERANIEGSVEKTKSSYQEEERNFSFILQ